VSSWGVVGGGMLGSTIAMQLARDGHEVTLFEAAPTLGGLASAWSLGPIVWDRHYHVTLASDRHTRWILSELGLEDEIRWVETRTGSWFDGRLYSMSSTMDYVRFPPLSFVDKARLAWTILRGSKIDDWERMEQIPVEDWLRSMSGNRVFDKFWLPLLESKLGDSYTDTSAAFIWATIQRLYAARSSGMKKEMFGYVPGGYARILDRLREVLEEMGVGVRVGTRVAAVSPGPAVTVGEDESRFDHVVVTAVPPIASRLVEGLSADERGILDGIRYQGIVCASVLTSEPLGGYYLTYLHDPAPFTAVVEMSAFVDPDEFEGNTLVYLPRYCAPDDPLFEESDESIQERFLDGLAMVYPQFDAGAVMAFRVSRVRNVFPIAGLGYSKKVPGFDTSIPGLHLASSAQIVNGTLNVNETVELAKRAAAHFRELDTSVLT